jgi:hypothetical protein
MTKCEIKLVHDLTFSLRGWQVLQWKMISLATFGSTLTQLQWYQASQPSQQTQDTLPSGLLQPSGPRAQALTFDVLFVLLDVVSFDPLFAFPRTILDCLRCFDLDHETKFVKSWKFFKFSSFFWSLKLSIWQYAVTLCHFLTIEAVISRWNWHKSNLNRSVQWNKISNVGKILHNWLFFKPILWRALIVFVFWQFPPFWSSIFVGKRWRGALSLVIVMHVCLHLSCDNEPKFEKASF